MIQAEEQTLKVILAEAVNMSTQSALTYAGRAFQAPSFGKSSGKGHLTHFSKNTEVYKAFIVKYLIFIRLKKTDDLQELKDVSHLYASMLSLKSSNLQKIIRSSRLL